jgi:hypothetical protein
MGTDMLRRHLLLIFAVALAATAVLVHLLDRRAEAALEKEHRKEGQDLDARVHAIEARQRASIGPRLPQRDLPIPVTSEGADPGDRPAPLPGEPDRKAAAALQRKFDEEPVNPDWARSAEQKYRGIVDAQLPPNSHVVSLDCRSDFCRLEVVHESIASSNDFLLRLFSSKKGRAMGDDAGGFRAAQPTIDADGKLDYVVYVARPGVSVALDPDSLPPPPGEQ